MVELLKEIFNMDNQVIYTDPRTEGVKHSEVDVFKIERELGCKTRIAFKDWLKKTVNWYKNSK